MEKQRYDTGYKEVGLPQLPVDRDFMYSFYKLWFMQDGYPGKRMDDGSISAHPIYGAYIVHDYLRLFKETKEKKYIEAAKKVADATLSHMQNVPNFNAIAFYYEDYKNLSYHAGKFYSGLTQARYLTPLFRLFKITKEEKYNTAVIKILNSLTVPQSKGGVCIQTSFGIAIEEYPHNIPTYVLNGWTTIIMELLSYSHQSKNTRAHELALKNIATLEKIINRYDCPEISLSRYQLTGFCYLKVISQAPKILRVNNVATYIDHKKYGMGATNNRWNNFVCDNDIDENRYAKNRQVLMNVVLSQINDTQMIEFEIESKSTKPGKLDFYISYGDYNPFVSAMPTKRWIWLDQYAIQPGINKVALQVENKNLPMIGYPTNFTKKLEDGNYNVYHWMHIHNFKKINKYYESIKLEYIKKKWMEYIKEWRRVDSLDAKNIRYLRPK